MTGLARFGWEERLFSCLLGTNILAISISTVNSQVDKSCPEKIIWNRQVSIFKCEIAM